MARLVLIGACAFLPGTAARAEWMSGRQLAETCATGVAVDRAMCVAYVMGVLDGYRERAQPVRTPADATAGQVRDVVAAYIAENPEKLALEGRELVKAAVVAKWPELQPKAAPAKAKARPSTRTKARTRRRN
ncbi:Rap1a/Tai family immunity protein [Novosphingobium sp. B1]|uniref:Rap1a/Tai family immunity protein n=1 Tax=Novosphingobium sp. B1 TaxID=1938756 RepID=UPI00111BF1E4|nr:Rap1a/Tai family immunity protein [Novosphingobium sp. B1]